MKNITITDNRIEENISVAPENVEVTLSVTEEHTEPIEINGMKIEGTFSITKNIGTTTLKEIDADISNIQCQITEAQAQIDALTAELLEKTTTKDQVAIEVETAISKQVLPDPVGPVEVTP